MYNQKQNQNPELDYISIIIKKTNDELKYWTGIQVDPKSKKFLQDLQELSNIIFSVEMINGSKNMEKCINLIVRELTRKTIKNLVNELYAYKEKASRFTPIDDLMSNYDNDNYLTPEYYGVNPYDQTYQTQPNIPINKYKTPPQVQEIPKQVLPKKYNLTIKDDKLKLNENNYYTFTLPNVNIKNIKLKTINIVNSDYNIDDGLCEIKYENDTINISEGYYKNINDLLNEINSKFVDKHIVFELNEINHRIRIKRANSSNGNGNGGGSAILQKTIKTIIPQENIDIQLNDTLAKILGFENGKMTGSSSYNARKLYKLPIKNKLYFTCKFVYIENEEQIIYPLVERYHIDVENAKFMDEIKLNDIPNNFSSVNGVESQMIEIKLEYENGELYNSRNSPFSFIFEYEN